MYSNCTKCNICHFIHHLHRHHHHHHHYYQLSDLSLEEQGANEVSLPAQTICNPLQTIINILIIISSIIITIINIIITIISIITMIVIIIIIANYYPWTPLSSNLNWLNLVFFLLSFFISCVTFRLFMNDIKSRALIFLQNCTPFNDICWCICLTNFQGKKLLVNPEWAFILLCIFLKNTNSMFKKTSPQMKTVV